MSQCQGGGALAPSILGSRRTHIRLDIETNFSRWPDHGMTKFLRVHQTTTLLRTSRVHCHTHLGGSYRNCSAIAEDSCTVVSGVVHYSQCYFIPVTCDRWEGTAVQSNCPITLWTDRQEMFWIAFAIWNIWLTCGSNPVSGANRVIVRV